MGDITMKLKAWKITNPSKLYNLFIGDVFIGRLEVAANQEKQLERLLDLVNSTYDIRENGGQCK